MYGYPSKQATVLELCAEVSCKCENSMEVIIVNGSMKPSEW